MLLKDMKYLDFKNRFKDYPIIPSSLFGRLHLNDQVLKNQVSGWKKKGLLLELRRGQYVLNENDRKINPSRMFLANQLYSPSYISCEYALMFYDLIPERVTDVTSITTKKTSSFRNSFGLFIYQHLSTACFRGFIERRDENNYAFFIALPEKALVDFVYLNLARFQRGRPDVFEQSFRFQNYAGLDRSLMLSFAQLFKSRKLFDVVEMFCDFMAKGG